jgi:hypothetical protein
MNDAPARPCRECNGHGHMFRIIFQEEVPGVEWEDADTVVEYCEDCGGTGWAP